MKMTSELYDLVIVAAMTSLMWAPYMLARMGTRGLLATFANPSPEFAPDPAWAERARRAHANAIENLAVFAPLVLIAALLGYSTAGTVLAAQIYLIARIIHFLAYTAGIPFVRTFAFVAGVAATLFFALSLLTAVA